MKKIEKFLGDLYFMLEYASYRFGLAGYAYSPKLAAQEYAQHLVNKKTTERGAKKR